MPQHSRIELVNMCLKMLEIDVHTHASTIHGNLPIHRLPSSLLLLSVGLSAPLITRTRVMLESYKKLLQ
jgi:hypothetical protein